jgi:hypothetical protein
LKEASVGEVSTIGLDLAKTVLQAHAARQPDDPEHVRERIHAGIGGGPGGSVKFLGGADITGS